MKTLNRKEEPFTFATWTCMTTPAGADCGTKQVVSVRRGNKTVRCYKCGQRHRIQPGELSDRILKS